MYMEKATNAKNQNASKNAMAQNAMAQNAMAQNASKNAMIPKNATNVNSTNGLNQPLLSLNQQMKANNLYGKPVEGGARKHKTKKAVRTTRPKKCKCKTQSRKHKHRRH
jgi:hypothetical protein